QRGGSHRDRFDHAQYVETAANRPVADARQQIYQHPIMNFASQRKIYRTGTGRAGTAGYTLVEISVAFAVMTLIGAGFLGFLVTTTRMTQGIVKQGVMNHQAGNGVEL